MMMMSSSKNKYPFTPSQWQELEHQALVFKYMVSGIPIPPDLLFTIRTSLHSKLLLHQHPQHLFQMGFGRKIDPEPGRCRRTDGKKWRCSKEAYPDSKYCERHMHRGRNRSRKPVEITSSSTPTIAIALNSQSESHFVYPHFSTSRPPSIGLSSQESTTNNFLLDSTTSHSSDKDFRNRYGSGMKSTESDEHTFFSGNDSSWKLDLSSQTKQKVFYTSQSDQQSYYSCDEQQPKKVMHHFLDEWSPKHDDSDNHQDQIMSTHRTQLSISTPTSMHDFFITRK